jgi:hypothetical protein
MIKIITSNIDIANPASLFRRRQDFYRGVVSLFRAGGTVIGKIVTINYEQEENLGWM